MLPRAVVLPPPLPRGPIAAIAGLTILVTLLGVLPWPRPFLAPTPDGGWVVSDVPGAMWALLLGTAALCVAIATVVTFRSSGQRFPGQVAWLGLVLLAAAALVWNAAYAAAFSVMDFGAIIPIFHWLFTLVPAVLAGAIVRRRGRQARQAAALGTGIVTVPLFHLGALLLVADSPVDAVLGGLWFTALLGVLPLIGGVALAGALGGRDRTGQLPYPYAG